jgi:uncharacterized protein (TIGR00369 family)
MPEAAMTAEELEARLVEAFPEAFGAADRVRIEALWHAGCRVRQPFQANFLRPGGTISGPTMMALADVTIYITVLGTIGWVPLAVTTQLSINFLRKPDPGDLIAEGRLLKLGKRLAVGEVAIRSPGSDALVAHATGTYSIPDRR